MEFQNRSTIHRLDSVVHQPSLVLTLPSAGPCLAPRGSTASSASKLFAQLVLPPPKHGHPRMLPSALDPFRKEKLPWKHAAQLWPIATSRFAPIPRAAIPPIFNLSDSVS